MVNLRSFAAFAASISILLVPSLGHSLARRPLEYISLIDDPIIQTPSHRVRSDSEFDLIFTLHNGEQRVRLSLQPNHDVLHHSLAVTRIGADGNVEEVEPVDRAAHRVFKGDAFTQRYGQEGWWKAGPARISILRDGKTPIFEGSFRIHGDSHQIQSASKYRKFKHPDDPTVQASADGNEFMVVWRNSDVQRLPSEPMELRRSLAQEPYCDSESLSFNKNLGLGLRNPLRGMDTRSLFGRQAIDGGTGGGGGGDGPANLQDTIGSTAGCPSTRQVALVGIATDCTYWGKKDENGFETESEMREHIIDMVNQASEVYESTFNISLGISNLTMIKDRDCPGTPSGATPWNVGCNSDVDIGERLNRFSAWRGKSQDKNAFWTLLTTCNTGSAVGLAWRGRLCQEGSSEQAASGGTETIASANVVVRTPSEWQVFAHEAGHVFGAVHDCTSQTCPPGTGADACCPLSSSSCDADGRYIMNPATGDGITRFSPCSIGNICSGLLGTSGVDGDCLTNNKDVHVTTAAQCGNGIVEEGEDCDCGGKDNCSDNNCCNPETCKFADGAVCDPTNEDCCTDECQFASKSTVCRESTGDCDPKETCPGDGPSCPKDKHKDDGTECGDGLRCASGQCTSRNLQCQVMMSDMVSNNDTSSCGDSSSCSMYCSAGGNTCVSNRQNYIDGTRCGSGGHCEGGECKGNNAVLGWIQDHKAIFIPVVSVVGALILFALLSCLWSSCRRGSAKRKYRKNPPMAQDWQRMRGSQPDLPPEYMYPPPPPVPPNAFQRQRSLRYA